MNQTQKDAYNKQGHMFMDIFYDILFANFPLE